MSSLAPLQLVSTQHVSPRLTDGKNDMLLARWMQCTLANSRYLEKNSVNRKALSF